MVDMFRLRSEIIVLDRPTIVQASIRDYLRLAGPATTSGDVLRALAMVGLEDRVMRLPDGLDTQLSTSGWPLSYAEALRLKLAGAMLKCPRLLILTGLFDMIDPAILADVRMAMRAEGSTVIQFSHRPSGTNGCQYLWLGDDGQRIIDDPQEFLQIVDSKAEEAAHGNA